MTDPIINSARFVVRGYSGETMTKAGQSVITENLKRWDSGLLVGGVPAPPLKQRTIERKKNGAVAWRGQVAGQYAMRKQRQGKRPTRDLSLTGALRQAMQVLTSKRNEATVGPLSGAHPNGGKRGTTFAGVLAINNWRARMWGVGQVEESAISATLAGEPFVITKAGK